MKISKGITLITKTGVYKATVTVNGKRYPLGNFGSAETAEAARQHVLRERLTRRTSLIKQSKA